MMKITVWELPNCVQCNQTKREFEKRGIIFTARKLTPKVADRFLAMGFTSAPIVETDAKRWSGFRLEKIKSLEFHLKNERRQGINVPLEPIKQVADELSDDDPTPEEIVETVKQVRKDMASEQAKGEQK